MKEKNILLKGADRKTLPLLSIYDRPEDYPDKAVIRRTGQWIPIGRDGADVKCLYGSYI